MEKKKVLIVDDHPAIRFFLRSLVETSDFFTVCGEATDGKEAIEKAPQLSPDVVLLDFSMPNMNGAEAAPVLKRLMPQVPIILFTLHEDSLNKALAAAMHVDRVIAKANGMTKLLECMCNLLGLPATKPANGSLAVGPLQVPIEPMQETMQSPQSASTEEKLPE